MLEPPSRRELRRAIRGRAIRGPGRPTPGGPASGGQRPGGPGRPTIFYYAVVVLVLAAIAAVVGGAVSVSKHTGLGVGLFVYAVVAVAAVWLLLRRTAFGYWFAVAVLAVTSGVPMAVLVHAGDPGGAIVVCPPLVVAILMAKDRRR